MIKILVSSELMPEHVKLLHVHSYMYFNVQSCILLLKHVG